MIGALLTAAKSNPVLAPWIGPLQALWPLLWRLALFGLLFAIGWHYGARNARADLADERAQLLEAHIAAVDVLRAEERAQDERAEKIEVDYESAKSELERIRARIPTRVVRVCQPTAGDRGVPVSVTGTVADGRAADRADVPRAAGRDIGPALYGLADQCDEIARRLLALQRWVATVPAADE